MDDIWKSALANAKNPLGIIALFIVMIYGFATLTLVVPGKDVAAIVDFRPVVWFIVIFPGVVLLAFIYILERKIAYAPFDFRTDEAFREYASKKIKAARLFGEDFDLRMGFAAAGGVEKVSNRLIVREHITSAAASATLEQVLAFKRTFEHPLIWFDNSGDELGNNTVAGLRALDVPLTFADTPDKVSEVLKRHSASAIIVDLHGKENSKAAIELLRSARERARSLPVIVYDPPADLPAMEANTKLFDRISQTPAQLLEVLNRL